VEGAWQRWVVPGESSEGVEVAGAGAGRAAGVDGSAVLGLLGVAAALSKRMTLAPPDSDMVALPENMTLRPPVSDMSGVV
jgi:hypothetical protein